MPRPSMRRPARVKSALFVERFSLDANWASSFQQMLLADNRPWLLSLDERWPGVLGAHRILWRLAFSSQLTNAAGVVMASVVWHQSYDINGWGWRGSRRNCSEAVDGRHARENGGCHPVRFS